MRSRSIVLIIFLSIAIIGNTAFTQTNFPDGIDVDGTYVFGNGLITNAQDDASVRDVATSIGQLYGIDPDTGTNLSNDALLTVKPKKLNLENVTNRQFAISADQITGDGSVTVDYIGSNVVLGLSETNVQVQGDLVVSSNLEANTITLGGFERSTWPEGDNLGDHTATQNIKLNGHWLTGDGDNEGVFVHGNGDVGIGTNAPCGHLEIHGAGANLIDPYFPAVAVFTSPNNLSWSLVFRSIAAGLSNITGFYVDSNGELTLSSETIDPIMQWKPDTGNVGIGVKNPTVKLDVAGAIKIGVGNTISGNAVGTGAFVQGTNCTASGENAHAEGTHTTASHYSDHAEGVYSTASGSQSHAEGLASAASGNSSHAEGDITIASGIDGAHAEGFSTIASGGEGAHAEGENTHASGWDGAHAEGFYTTASGSMGAHAEGMVTSASGDFGAHAEGESTTASGIDGAHAEGWCTTSSGWEGSHAEGYGSEASGNSSHAEGDSTIASGESSHAEGCNTRAFGFASHAAGYLSVAQHDNTYVWSDTGLGLDGLTPVSSTKSKQFTVHASNGIRLLGGPTEIVPAGDLAMGIYTNHP